MSGPPEGLPRSSRGLAALAQKFHRDQRGQLIYLTIACVIAFVAGAALVMNSGNLVSQRIRAQNAADASAAAASSVVARGMNLISINNVATTEILAVAVVLRALKDTWKQGSDKAAAITAWLPKTCAALEASAYLSWLAPACFAWLAAVEASQAYFDGHLSLFGGVIDYATDPNGGVFWTAMEGLSAVSGTVAVTFPAIARTEAMRIARRNGMERALIAPLLPTMPVAQGRFSDLCHPARWGSPASYPAGLRRGYYPFIDDIYRGFDRGPVPVYRDIANGPALRLAFYPLLSSSPLPEKTDERFAELCRGSQAGYAASRSEPGPYLIEGMRRSTNTSVATARAVRDQLNHLAVVSLPTGSIFMASRFTNPRERLCAYGQTRVFNPTSFDLFTPDWRMKLVRADMLDAPGEAALALAEECRDPQAALAASALNLH